MTPRHRRLARAGLLVALVLTPAACRTWQPPGTPVADAVRRWDPARPARLVLRDGRELMLDSLAARGDSVVGYTRTSPPVRTAVPIADVVRVEERRADAGGTAANTLTVFGLAGVALLVLALVFLQGYSDP